MALSKPRKYVFLTQILFSPLVLAPSLVPPSTSPGPFLFPGLPFLDRSQEQPAPVEQQGCCAEPQLPRGAAPRSRVGSLSSRRQALTLAPHSAIPAPSHRLEGQARPVTEASCSRPPCTERWCLRGPSEEGFSWNQVPAIPVNAGRPHSTRILFCFQPNVDFLSGSYSNMIDPQFHR